jgi:hypothetical protein
VFIGVKMLISPVVHLPVWVSLAVIVVVAGGAVAASLWRDRSRPRQAPKQCASPDQLPDLVPDLVPDHGPDLVPDLGPGHVPGQGRVPEPHGPVRT